MISQKAHKDANESSRLCGKPPPHADAAAAAAVDMGSQLLFARDYLDMLE